MSRASWVLAALIVAVLLTAGCALTGSKTVLTVETTATPCLPTPPPEPIP